MKAYVVLNGERIKNISSIIGNSSYVYCADGGADYLFEHGIIPKTIMGDMDSISKKAKSFYADKGCDFEMFPCEKDETDGQIIVDRALKDEPDEVVILCGLGGRIDHLFGNIQLLYRIAKRGAKASIVGDGVTVIMSHDIIRLERHDDELISIVPYTDDAVLTLTGFRYNVEQFKFEKDTPVGISNYLIEEWGEITIHKGYPIVIVTRNN